MQAMISAMFFKTRPKKGYRQSCGIRVPSSKVDSSSKLQAHVKKRRILSEDKLIDQINKKEFKFGDGRRSSKTSIKGEKKKI
jgi:hypothetical protein